LRRVSEREFRDTPGYLDQLLNEVRMNKLAALTNFYKAQEIRKNFDHRRQMAIYNIYRGGGVHRVGRHYSGQGSYFRDPVELEPVLFGRSGYLDLL
jgi:hypothetical protein